jgi:hypothetical protein
MKKQTGGRQDRGEIRGDRGENNRRRGTRRGGAKITQHFFTTMKKSFFKVNVLNNNFVYIRAGKIGKGDKRAIRRVPTTPKVNSCSISVSDNEFGVGKINSRKIKVVNRRMDKGRTNSKKRHNKRPNILENIINIKKRISTDKCGIREPPPPLKGIKILEIAYLTFFQMGDGRT